MARKFASVPSQSHPKRDVLFMVMGISPAILTETCWALRQEGIVPDEICLVTTTTGKRAMERALFGADRVWEQLWKSLRHAPPAFGPVARYVKVLSATDGSGEMDDILTPADHTAAADQIMRELRAYVADPSVRIIASLAGGRKTMGAILTSCMVLMGRPGDRLSHVLVNPPFDSPLDPPFFYPPDRPVEHRDRDGASHSSELAQIQLVDLPYVRTAGWYQDRFHQLPMGYMDLVALAQGRMPEPGGSPKVRLLAKPCAVEIGELPRLGLPWKSWVLLYHVAACARRGRFPKSWGNAGGCLAELEDWAGDGLSAIPWLCEWSEGDDSFPGTSGARNQAMELRKCLLKHRVPGPVVDRLVPKLNEKSPKPYPADRIDITLD